MKLTTTQKQGLMVLLFIGLVFAGIRLRTLWVSPEAKERKQGSEMPSAQLNIIDINAASAIEFEKLPALAPCWPNESLNIVAMSKDLNPLMS